MSTPGTYFTEMYRDADDPWNLGSLWYERRKYGITVASLPRPVYARAFEPGCSAGVLSYRLADRCEYLLSCDRSERAVVAAQERLASHPHVEVQQRVLPEEWPDERFSLVVLSELLYYFDPPQVDDILQRAVESLEPFGTLLAVHWRHPVADHAQSGDAVHDAARSTPGLVRIGSHVEPDFLLDVFVRTDRADTDPRTLSVAADEGLA